MTCLLPFYAGCSGSDATTESEQAELTSVSPLDTEQTEAGEDDQASSRYVSRESLPEHWLPPIQDTDQFFTPPAPSATPVAPTQAKMADANVRLLGFAKVGSGADAARKAILKFADDLVYMKVGDSHSGVELVSIEEKSVNLQQGRERWTLALMSQPITNAPVPYPAARQRQTASKSNSFQPRGFPDDTEPSPFPNDDFAPGANDGFPPAPPAVPEISMPDIPEIDLPDFDMPDFDIPGFEIPKIPGF